MAIDARPSSIMDYLRDQKYVGGNNSLGNIVTSFLSSYLSGKKVGDENKAAEFNKTADASNAAQGVLQKLGLAPNDASLQMRSVTPSEMSGNDRMAGFAKAFLGDGYRMEDLVLKSKEAGLKGQMLANQEKAGELDDTPTYLEGITRLERGLPVDDLQFKSPTVAQKFAAQKVILGQKNKMNGASANFGEYLNNVQDFSDPKVGQTILQFGAKNPEFAQTPQYKAAYQNYQVASKLKADADAHALKFKNDSDLLNRKQDFQQNLETTKDKSRLELEAMRQSGLNERQLKTRLGDIGYRAFQADQKLISSDKDLTLDQKKGELAKIYRRAKEGAYSQGGNPAAAAVPPTTGQTSTPQTATNPKTGEKIQFINGAWQPVK